MRSTLARGPPRGVGGGGGVGWLPGIGVVVAGAFAPSGEPDDALGTGARAHAASNRRVRDAMVEMDREGICFLECIGAKFDDGT
jgi:hypothetical protein